MAPEILFLATIDDLDRRLELDHGAYDAFYVARLLRQLLHPVARSLVALVNREHRVALSFNVRECRSTPLCSGRVPILPTSGRQRTVELSTKDFLSHTVIVAAPGHSDRARHEISVRQLMLFLAGTEGAIRWGQPKWPWEKAIAEFGEAYTYRTPRRKYTGAVFCLIEPARVARAGLEPLRAVLQRSTSLGEPLTNGNRQRVDSIPAPEPTSVGRYVTVGQRGRRRTSAALTS